MEKYKNPFENYKPDLFPKLSKISRCIGSFILERHQVPNMGGGPLLDELVASEIPESTQLMLDWYTLEP